MIPSRKIDPKDYEAAFLFNHFLHSCYRDEEFTGIEDSLEFKAFWGVKMIPEIKSRNMSGSALLECRNLEEETNFEETSSNLNETNNIFSNLRRATSLKQGIYGRSTSPANASDASDANELANSISTYTNELANSSTNAITDKRRKNRASHTKKKKTDHRLRSLLHKKTKHHGVKDLYDQKLKKCIKRENLIRFQSKKGKKHKITPRSLLESEPLSFLTEHENSMSSDFIEDAKAIQIESNSGIMDGPTEPKLPSLVQKILPENSCIFIENFREPSMGNEPPNLNFRTEEKEKSADLLVLEMYEERAEDFSTEPVENPGFTCSYCRAKFSRKPDIVEHLLETHAQKQ